MARIDFLRPRQHGDHVHYDDELDEFGRPIAPGGFDPLEQPPIEALDVAAGLPPEALYMQPSPESLGRSEGPYGAGSPPDGFDLEPALGPEDYEGLLQFGDDVSTRQLTPGELRTFPAGFQAIATPDERPELPEQAPPPFAEQSAHELFGKAYGALAPEQRQMALQGAARDANQQAAYEYSIQRPDMRGPPPRALRAPSIRRDTLAKAGKVIGDAKPITPYQAEQQRLAQGRLDLSRDRFGASKAGRRAAAGPPRPGAAAARTAARGEVGDRLRSTARSVLGVEELPPEWEGEISAITRLGGKDQAKAEIRFNEKLRKKQLADVRGGVQASPAKRTEQVAAFDRAQKRYGLFINEPTMYTDMINSRGSATRMKNVTTINRSMHASARLIELDQLYRKIPVRLRGTEAALELVAEYNYLKQEHQGIILQISGAGQGTEAAREEILEELPSIGTTWAHFSGPNLRGLHKMLVVNAEANMIMMGIGINHKQIGNMYRGKHPGNPTGKKHTVPKGETAEPEAAEPPPEPDETGEDEDEEWEEL
jgi:hypothetical protein